MQINTAPHEEFTSVPLVALDVGKKSTEISYEPSFVLSSFFMLTKRVICWVRGEKEIT